MKSLLAVYAHGTGIEIETADTQAFSFVLTILK